MHHEGLSTTGNHEADEPQGGSAEPMRREVMERGLREAHQPQERRTGCSDVSVSAQDIPERSEEGDGCHP